MRADQSDRLLTSVRQPVILEANLPNITVGFKTGPNVPGTQFTIKCVIEGDGCAAPGQGQSVSGLLPVTPAAVEGTVLGLDVDETYSCYVETYLTKEKLSFCREAEPLPGTVEMELLFPAYTSAAAFGQREKDQICANLLSLQPGVQCSVVSVMDGGVKIFIQIQATDYRDAWSLGAMLKQGGSEVNAVLVRGLEGPVEIADVVAEPPFPASTTAATIVSATPKTGSETDTLVVTWVPGDDSVPPAGDPAFYVACVLGGSPCPSSPIFDVDRPLGVEEITDVAGLTEGTLYDCYVVAKDWDGTGVCSEPAQVSTYQRVSAPAILSAEPKAGAETDTLVVTWVPGDDSVPPAGDPAFYMACVLGGSPCPSSPIFDVDRPLGVEEITDVAGLTEGTLYDCYVVAKDWDGTGVCSEPVSSITLCDVSLNYEAVPVNGKCVCKPGFIDLNGDPSDGCEYEQTCTIGDGNPVFYQDCNYQSSTWQPFCLTEGTYDVSTKVADMSSMQVADGYRVSFKYNPDSQTCVTYSPLRLTSSIPCFTDVTCYGPEGSSVRDINDVVVQVTVIKDA